MARETLTAEIGSYDDELQTFGSWKEVIRWLEAESAKWEWMVPGDGVTDRFSLATTVRNGWNNLRSEATEWQNQGQPLATIKDALDSLWSSGLAVSESRSGRLILDIRKSAGDRAGSFAYAFIRGQIRLNEAETREDLLGAMLTALPDLTAAADLSERLQEERQKYRNSVANTLAKVRRDDSARIEAVEEKASRAAKLIAQMVRKRRDRWSEVQRAWQASSTDAVNSIQAVEAAYLEKMALKAPVQYWKTKAGEHGVREGQAARNLIVFFLIASLILGVAYYEAGKALFDVQQVHPSIYFIISAGLVVASTFAFWIGRLLTKLYLSEHHLRNDADERAIMTETYLALTAENAASEGDRNIILGALFRGTPDGIVKEDGPSDFSIQALLSRFAIK
jgi:hypothetical protein